MELGLLLLTNLSLLLLLMDSLSLLSLEVTEIPLLLHLENIAFLSAYLAVSVINFKVLWRVDFDLCML